METMLIKVLGAVFCWVMAVYALGSGTLIMKGRYSKTERPVTYWFGLISYIFLGFFVLFK